MYAYELAHGHAKVRRHRPRPVGEPGAELYSAGMEQLQSVNGPWGQLLSEGIASDD